MDACEARLEIRLRGRALRDMDLFSKSDPFAVLYLDAAGAGGDAGASDSALAYGALSEGHARRSSIASSSRPSTASRRSHASGGSGRSRRSSHAAARRPWGSAPIPAAAAASDGGRRTRDAGLPTPLPRAGAGVRSASVGGVMAAAAAAAAAAGLPTEEKKRKKKSRHRGDATWSEVAAEVAEAQRRWTRVGVTETIQNQLDPQWVAAFEVPYFFERTQWLRVEVYDRDTRGDQHEDLSKHDFIGAASVRVPELVRASGQTATLELRHERRPGGKNGWVTLVAEEVSTLKQTVHLDFGVEHIRPRAAGMLGLGSAVVRLAVSRLTEVAPRARVGGGRAVGARKGVL
ncbi:hypothetical protein BU14_0330s0011 [Porphyra umbilicalis]|uniref:C2 domain-containing protein n=1 Tax=Porphyra umbilicalis TaxID=2786 RepID=A0A1X6NYM5_PORUM|nr:hypothetical protein BU14_0330s0011 [Porphyra umbilicalis]|eukprot:OSX73721.1 hypothetical protein BU14_0330s0011 [Porphyra umbilicalis]